MLFDNNINTMVTYLDRHCSPQKMDKLESVSDAQVNLLLDLLTIAHKLKCDIYATGSSSNSRFLGIGIRSLEQSQALQGNLFLKIKSDRLHISFGPEQCSDENILTPDRVIDALSYLSERPGKSLLPQDFPSET